MGFEHKRGKTYRQIDVDKVKERHGNQNDTIADSRDTKTSMAERITETNNDGR